MKSIKVLLFLFAFAIPLGSVAQSVGLKTNMLYNATATPNLGLEVRLGEKLTLNMGGGVNVLDLKPTVTTIPSTKHWSANAELRYWFCRSFDGTFLGVQALYTDYVIEDVPLLGKPRKYRFDGMGYGASLVVGNHWALGKRWGMELSGGLGVIFSRHDKILRGGGANMGEFEQIYCGPTKLNFSIIYLL